MVLDRAGAIGRVTPALILLVRWSDASLPAYGLIPIGLVDYAFVCGLIWLIEEALLSESKIS